MRKLKLFLDAKAANTPPRGISKASRVIFSVLTLLLLSVGNVWALANTYTKVTDVASLSNGDKVVIAMGSPTTGVKGGTVQSSTSTKKDAVVSTTESEWIQFTVSTTTDGWYLTDGTNFIGKPTANTFYLTTSNDCKGICSVDENGVLMCNSRYLVQNSSYYRMYNSVGSYTPFYVWKVDAGEDPTITLKQSNTAISKLDVVATSVANQAIDLEYANFTGSISSVTTKLYEESTCETEITSGAWVTDITINAAKTQLTFNVADNDGASRQVWLKVFATDGTGNASAVLNIKQAKYEAPFTGEVLEITKDDFASGSYAANDGGITVEGFDFAVKDMYKNSNIIQAKASSGYIYNKSILGEIVKIEITKSGAANNNFTVYEGTSEHPLTTSVSGDVDGTTTTYEFSEDQTYFTLKNGSTYSTVNPIKIYYYPIKSAVTIDNSIENGSVGVTGAADLTQVAVGTVLTLTNTPDASYKLTAYDVYKTGEATTKVTVTDGKFTMPAYAVTVSGSFELARDLTSIAISSEASKKTYLVGETFSSEGLEITASFSNAADAVVTPTSISSPDMSTAGVKTITISYTEGANTETTSYDITVKDAYTVTEILPMVPALNAGSLATRVKGYISQIDEVSTQHGNATYYISDNGARENELEAFRGKYLNNVSFTSEDQIEVGDFVTITGNVKTYGTVKEFDQGNYITVLVEKGDLQSVAVSGTPTKTEYAANEDFDPAGLVVTGTYANGYVGVITEGITWGNDLTDNKVTETTTIHVTATVSGITNSPAHNVGVTVAAKTLLSIAVDVDSYTIYTGEALPQPNVTATYSEGEPEDVSAFAVYDSENVFNTVTIDNPDPQTITVSYTFGGATQTATYTVSVKDYANADDAPYTVTEALHIITDAIGSTESAREIVVAGTVNEDNISNNKNRYKISDGENELLVYAGKGFESVAFTNTNYPKVGDVVIVKGNVIHYNSNTPEFASGKSYLLSQVRPTTLAIEDIASFEVGAEDMAEADLTVTKVSEGAVTLASSDHEEYVTIVDGKLHAVAPGTATITANLAATANENALNYAAASTTFNVTVIAAQVKYAITFDGNGADGGSAPEAIADKSAGVPVTLPANAWTKDGYQFSGWKVFYVDGESVEHEVTISENAFTMPAFAVTIQAQWAEISEWATTYTSNLADVNNGGSIVKFYGEDTEYKAIKAGTGKAAGSTTITVPAQASKLHFHAYGWNGESVTLSITAPAGVTVSPASQAISANTGISGSTSTYTLAEGSTPETDAYFAVNLSGNNDEIELTISATSGNRFVLFGVNQEGGVLPVLDHIVVTGTATALEYEVGDVFNPAGLGANAIYTLGGVEQEPVAIDADDIEWSFEPATIAANTTAVTVTATYEGKSADKEVTGLTVSVPEPEIEVSATSLAFGKVAKGATVADKELTVTLKSVENATLAISGDGASAFSLDEYALTATGVVTVSASSANVGTFEATLTISDDANAAEAQEVALSITIEAADDLSGKWTLVTDDAILQAGMKVIIASIAEGSTITTLGKQAGANADGNNRVGVTGGSVSGTVLTPAAGTKVFTLVDAGEGKLAFQGTNGKYLYAASSSSNHLKEQATNDANGKWTISIDDDAKATITAQGSNSRSLMRFNPNNGNPIFACYAPNTNTGTEVSLYTLDGYSRNVTEGRMGTVCVDHNVPAGNILGAEVYQLLFWKYGTSYADCQMVDFEQVDEMEAGKPYMIIPTANKMRLIYGETSVNAPVAYHGFTGTFEAIAASATNVLVGKYGIVNNSIQKLGENCSSQANRAYIDLSQTPSEAEYEASQTSNSAPKKRVSLSHKGTQVTTGLDAINLDTENVQKVMIEGQIYIIRGGHVFTTSGSLVK